MTAADFIQAKGIQLVVVTRGEIHAYDQDGEFLTEADTKKVVRLLIQRAMEES